VAARAIISSGVPSFQTACTGVIYPGNNPNLTPRTCYSQIYTPDINQILLSPALPGMALNLEP